MRFILITEKTTNQCMKALNERMQIKGTKSRPELDGWVEKSGSFSIAMSSKVFGKFTRKTRLRATAQREDGMTVIRGFVPNGVSREWLVVIGIAIVLLAIYMFSQGQLMFSIAVLLAGGAMTIPLWGDHRNHDILLYELEKTLKATPAPPKIPAAPARKPARKSSAKPAKK